MQEIARAVVLDIVMPELDGSATLERIRDMSDVPPIMLTQRDTEIERIRGVRSGADDYVGKPYSPGELAGGGEAQPRLIVTARGFGYRYEPPTPDGIS